MELAQLLRPHGLSDFIGQKHLVGPNKPLSQVLEKGHIFSMILWGPPGVGKTTLARILALETNHEFHELSAVSASKNDIREILKSTGRQRTLTEDYASPVLFLDEIHRFNKAQQDFLLPYVENGDIILIGATTENPSFEVISALLSRMKVFTLEQLQPEELSIVINSALSYLTKKNSTSYSLDEETKEWLINYSAGDARKLINVIEQTESLYSELTLETFKSTIQSTFISYDKAGESHYNTISAFIKSMRASNADAALYYLARMVHAGEDPVFIARRMVIFASEDIGLVAPTALVVANAVFTAVQSIGYPEAQINLAHGVAYLCQCKKDRSAHDAYFEALGDVQKFGNLPIPLELRNAPTKLMKELNYGKDYEMYPDKQKSLLPDKIKRKKYLKKS